MTVSMYDLLVGMRKINISCYFGDVPLQMTYSCESQIKEIDVVIMWFEFMLALGKGCHLSIYKGLPTEYRMVIIRGLREGVVGRLIYDLLVPVKHKVSYANHLYFLHKNGLE